MADSTRENELAELLAEVRALREDVKNLSPSVGVRRQGYAVLAVVDAAPDVDYNVLVSPQLRDPSYEVLVRPQLPEPSGPVENG